MEKSLQTLYKACMVCKANNKYLVSIRSERSMFLKDNNKNNEHSNITNRVFMVCSPSFSAR